MNDNTNHQITSRSEFCCLIGRDSRDNEQRELSPGTSRFFSEKLHTLNYTSFLYKVRDTFLDIERGESYYEHTVQPKTFFYCPMIVSSDRSSTRSEAAAVWGECGLYGDGREFRFAHIFFEDYSSLDPHELLCKLFSTRFLNGDEITSRLDLDKNNDSIDFGGEYSKVLPKPEERFRRLAATAAEGLCAGNTVVIRLAKTADFNSAAHDILFSIVSLLPGELRKQIGFASYLQKRQLGRFITQSNNLRLIVVDSDAELSELASARGFMILESGEEHTPSEAFELWSRIEHSERELHYERFTRSRRRVPTAELIPELSRLYREGGLLPETSLEKADDNEKSVENSAPACEAEPNSEEKSDNNSSDVNTSENGNGMLDFLKYREVKLIAAIGSLLGLVIGIIVGLIL